MEGMRDHMVRVPDDEYEFLRNLKEDQGLGSIVDALRCLVDSFIENDDDDEEY